MKNMKIAGAIFAATMCSGIYAMMQEYGSAKDILKLSQDIQKVDLFSYGENNKRDVDYEIKRNWDACMMDTHLLTNDKEFSGLKTMYEKLKDFAEDVFGAANVIYYTMREDGLKALDKVKKKQSEVKRFMLGQKVKSAFSFGKKDKEYKQLKETLLGVFDILNGKVDRMKKYLEIKKK